MPTIQGPSSHGIAVARSPGNVSCATSRRWPNGSLRARYAINLCENRYRFAVAFCAALLRGQVSLLPHNRTLEGVAEVAARYPSHFYLDDAGVRAEHPTGTAVPWAQARVDSGVASDGRVVGSESVPGVPADRAAAIVFTSGSTGSPRSHEKNWGSLAALASLQHGYLRQRHADLSGSCSPRFRRSTCSVWRPA